jgi:hypothetical protein
VDYRRFLQKEVETVAPVVEQDVWLRDRRLHFSGAAAGWWRVRVRGRDIELVRAATEEEVSAALAPLPSLRGPVLRVGGGWALVVGGSGCQPVELPRSDEEPPLFSPLRARRWPTGELLFWDELEWESEAEEAARRALEDDRGLGEVKGASAGLRAAFAFATAQVASRALGIPAAPAELRGWVREIAEQGRPAAESALRALAAERVAWAERARRRSAAMEAAERRDGARARDGARVRDDAHASDDIESRVEDSLRGAGARMLGVRRLGDGLVEVRWQFGGVRLTSVVQARGLGVVDAGVCLAGADALVTLDSLPGVVREAIDEEALVITRHGED